MPRAQGDQAVASGLADQGGGAVSPQDGAAGRVLDVRDRDPFPRGADPSEQAAQPLVEYGPAGRGRAPPVVFALARVQAQEDGHRLDLDHQQPPLTRSCPLVDQGIQPVNRSVTGSPSSECLSRSADRLNRFVRVPG